FDLFLDLGTGTGRMLELFRERYRRGLGIDLSPAMLAYARAKLEGIGAGRAAARVLAPAGRLLIVDFAPHELEFLREQFAHERLGFSTQQVGQWLADCGLELVETRDLVRDHDGAANLTVS